MCAGREETSPGETTTPVDVEEDEENGWLYTPGPVRNILACVRRRRGDHLITIYLGPPQC